MIPLKQFVCDTCHQLIEKTEHGYLAWLNSDSDDRNKHFRIIHKNFYSPHYTPKRLRGCYTAEHLEAENVGHLTGWHLNDISLTSCEYPENASRLLFMVANYTFDTEQDRQDFVEIMRRLMLPDYEQARIYIQENDALFHELEEIAPEYRYAHDVIQRIIRTKGGTIYD